MKITKKDSENKQETNIENYLRKKNVKKREYGRNRYQNMSEENKQRLKNIKENYRKAKKST